MSAMNPETLEAIADAWATIARRANVPALQERMRRESGVDVQRTGIIALHRLSEQGPLLISELAEAAGVDVSTMSRMLRQLEGNGCVVRQRGIEDQRCVHMRITEAGEEALGRARSAWQRILEEVLRDWPDADRQAFAALMNRFADGFVAYTTRREDVPAPAR
jgi:DNA-binding MarR family transcriptional regulator